MEGGEAEGSLSRPARRPLFLKWAVCGALLTEMALSPRLWQSVRAFPTVPAIRGLPELPQSITLALAWLLIGTILAIAALSKPRLACYTAPVLGVILVLFDINRLQPWFYQYLLMIVALSLVNWDDREDKRTKAALALCGFVLIAIYFWSGLQKANYTFETNVFPWLIKPLHWDSLVRVWFLAPVTETAIGILLLIPRTRKWGLVGVVALHAFILYVLGPLGNSFNSIIWPWNIWMVALALILFFRNPEPIVKPAWLRPTGKAIVLLVGAMPILSFFGLWDDYLSASLYSGKPRDAHIMLTEAGEMALRPAIQSHVEHGDDFSELDLSRWAMSEIGVPPYPELRNYQGIARGLAKQGVPQREMVLEVTDPAGLFKPKSDYRSVSFR